jgi:hypothetical protein
VIVRCLRRVVLIGLGVLAGAVLPATARTQAPVKRDTSAGRRDTIPDTVAIPLPARADSMIRNDSIAQGILGERERRRVDTLKAPLARAEAPAILEIGTARIYDRSAILATGALTLSDLLGRVPGLTTFATGWLLGPTAVASEGNLHGIRIFLDGLELDPMNQREQGRSPVNEIPLHTLEEVRIERGAADVRVYARTWRVVSTTPYTRADVLTGDQNTNLYRGYFGRRYDRGEGLQVSAEQLSTQPTSSLPSSDGQSFLVRVGLARGPWSADVLAVRSGADRSKWVGQGGPTLILDTIAAFTTRRTTAYLRLANGDPDAERWGQVIASSHSFIGTAAKTTAVDTLVSHDSTTYESQYLFTGGVRRGPVRVSAAERIRVALHDRSAVPSARASLETGPLALSAFAEGKSPFLPSHAEATARAQLLSRVSMLGSVSRSGSGTVRRVLASGQTSTLFTAAGSLTDLPLGPLAYDSSAAPQYELAARTDARAEAGVRLRDVWLTVGLLHRGATTLLPAAGLDSVYGRAPALRTEGSATARTASLRGRLWRAMNVDAWALAWSDSTGLYRPKYQTRAELYLQTNLLDRFPRGNFGILGSVAHEYRSNARFASTGDSVRTAMGSRTLDFRLEIRIQTAVISYQFRNVLQQSYAQVPGFTLPRQTQFYGVRWDFWN